MATWKKIIVSGSEAHLQSITASNLTENDLVIAGTGGALENSGLSLSTNVLDIGVNSIQSTGADSILSGSFSGSFQGDGSGLTGLPTTLTIEDDALNTDGVDLLTDTLNFEGGNSLTTAVTDNKVSIGVDNGGITETQLNTSVAGTGLSGGGGTSLSVDYGSIAGTAAQGNTSVTFNGTANEIELSTNTFTTVGGGGVVTIGLPDNVTIGNDLTVIGDLVVQGETTTLNTTNLLVEDKFILLASGSTAAGDGGIIVDDGGNSGKAFFLDGTTSGRWGFNENIGGSATSSTPEAFAAAVIDVDGSAHTDTAEYQKNGNIKVEGGDIWIYG